MQRRVGPRSGLSALSSHFHLALGSALERDGLQGNGFLNLFSERSRQAWGGGGGAGMLT